jgi:hypothetical protein
MEGFDWIYLAQDRGQWQAVMKRLVNLRVAWSAGYFSISYASINFREGILIDYSSDHYLPKDSAQWGLLFLSLAVMFFYDRLWYNPTISNFILLYISVLTALELFLFVKGKVVPMLN